MHLPRNDDHGRNARLRKHLEEAARLAGFELHVVEVYTESVTDKVVTDLRDHCDCMLQVVTRRLREGKERLDLSWLIGEYFAAAALKPPRVRMVDTFGSRIAREEWSQHLKVHRDQDFIEFDSAGDDDHLKTKFGEAINELAKELEEQRRGMGEPRA